MPDWSAEIRRRLAPLALSPAREREIVGELSQHLQDRYDEAVRGGRPEDEARRAALSEARAGMDALARQLAGRYPESNKDHTIPITPYYEQIVHDVRPALVALMGAVAFVLLIACANLATLTLARAEGRRREVAIRATLGADRWRLLRQFLTESVLLAFGGGALGALLFRVSPHDPATDAAMAALVTAAAPAAGYLPGRRATRIDPIVALREE